MRQSSPSENYGAPDAHFSRTANLNTCKSLSNRVISIIWAHFPTRGDMENTRERLETTRATEMARPRKNSKKAQFFSFWGYLLYNSEGSTQAAPRAADSAGTCLDAPILEPALSSRVTAIPKSQSRRKCHFWCFCVSCTKLAPRLYCCTQSTQIIQASYTDTQTASE